jgi:hypothetical protein
VVRRSIMRAAAAKAVGVALVVAAGAALFVAAGCMSPRPEPKTLEERRAAELADTLREEALKLPQDANRERMVTGLIMIRDLLRADAFGTAEPLSEASVGTSAAGMAAKAAAGTSLPEPEGGATPAPPWAMMFAPKSLVIGFFTRSKNFTGAQQGAEGIEVRIQPLDQFGDPTKAVGSYRVEVFEYRPRSGEKRGVRQGHWFVSVLDAESNRKYYDSVDRSYVFPLLWEKPIAAGTSVIVQATYYPPGGFTEKLFAQRVIKIGAEGE